MKIVHIYKNYYPVMGGIENYIKILAEEQARRGFDVTVLCAAPSMMTVCEEINSVKVIRAACMATIARTPISLSMLKWVHSIKADITHLHFPYPAGEFANFFFGRTSRTVITYHSDIIKQKHILKFYRPLLLKILDKADKIIVTSPKYQETSAFLKDRGDKCAIVPLGVDISRFRDHKSVLSEEIKHRYESSKLLLFVGRLRYFKGLQYLVHAMKSVKATLLIIGTGPEENHLKRLVLQEGLSQKVIFLQDIPDDVLPAYYSACDLFVLPSSHRSEAFGTVLIEAMASGKPVISTELGTGTSFVNVDGKTGFVVPPRDPESLSKAINRLLEDDALRKEFAFNASKRSEEFSIETLNESIINIYAQLKGERK